MASYQAPDSLWKSGLFSIRMLLTASWLVLHSLFCVSWGAALNTSIAQSHELEHVQAHRVDYKGRDEYLPKGANIEDVAPEEVEAEQVCCPTHHLTR